MSVPYSHRELFATHASAPAIWAELQKAERAHAESVRYLDWLLALWVRRNDEINAGTWPPKKVSA